MGYEPTGFMIRGNAGHEGFHPMALARTPGMVFWPGNGEINPTRGNDNRLRNPTTPRHPHVTRERGFRSRSIMLSGGLFRVRFATNPQTNRYMKNIQRTLLVSLVPLLTPLTAMAETGERADRTNSIQDREGKGHAWRASNVIGTNVKNADNETIGEVEDIVLDMKNGEVIAVIISSGGFLGIGESLSAVPVSVVLYDDQAKGFKTRLTKEQLGRAPQFKADEWPDYSDTTSSEALRSFRATLDGGAHDRDTTTRTDNTARDADNTAQNKKDENRARTPMDQGNSAADIKMTKDIRSGIMDTDMSSNAKNIKIVSRNERVTLNGVVDSHDEHQAILKIAESHCEKARVTDNLVVKTR